jgi:hypothetical protein
MDAHDARPAFGQRPGLVEDDDRDVTGTLEGLAPLDEQPHGRAAARRDHDGGRHRQPHRARARDDEHCDGGGEGARHGALPARHQPDHPGEGGDADHGRHEHRTHAVGELLDRRPRGLRFAHEAHDVREH